MRILSQDGNRLIDISNGGYLCKYDGAVDFVLYNSDYFGITLGTFKSEERAKEVLEAIAYAKYDLYIMPEV